MIIKVNNHFIKLIAKFDQLIELRVANFNSNRYMLQTYKNSCKLISSYEYMRLNEFYIVMLPYLIKQI